MLPISTLMQRFQDFSWFFWVQFWKLCLPSVTLMQQFEKFLMISLSSVLKILLVISTLMQRFDKILMTFLSPVLKILLAISTSMQRFEKFLMTYVIQFWQSVLCCNDLRSFSWFFESSSENACNRFFAATIWEVSIEFLVQFWKCSQSVLRCEHLRSLSWTLSPFLKRRAILYLAAKIWEVSHYFCVQFWKNLQSVICCCEDLKSLSRVFESSSKNACISILLHRFEKIFMISFSPVLKLLAISTLLQRFEKFLMIFWVQYWKCMQWVLLCSKDLRHFSWFLRSVARKMYAISTFCGNLPDLEFSSAADL
jgi:hypothetical protein